MKIRFVLKTFTFLFFMHPQTSKSVTSLQILPHIRSYTFINFFKSLRIIKMKFDQILVTLTRNIFNLFLALFSSILDTFTIFIRWQYNVICQFVADEHLPRANSYLVFDYLQVGKSKRCTWIYNPILKVMQMFTYFACEYTY